WSSATTWSRTTRASPPWRQSVVAGRPPRCRRSGRAAPTRTACSDARARGPGVARGAAVNTFGQLLRVTTFGESHGPAIGCVVDGCPPGIALAPGDFARDLERRATGRSRHTSARREE